MLLENALEGIRATLLGDDILDYFASDIGQAEIAAAVSIRQLGVVEAEKFERRGMKIVRVNGLVDRLETEVIRGAVDGAAFYAAAG